MTIRKKTLPFTLDNSKIYKPSQIREVLEIAVNKRNLKGTNKGVKYYNIPCSFDIETTSFYVDENGEQLDYLTKIERERLIEGYQVEKRATMYIWQFGVNGQIVIGRTWDEFRIMLIEISEFLELNEKKRLLVYVHNLAYEFQFICKQLVWWFVEDKNKVFSTDERKPIYAITNNFIEFRCSLFLSGYSLDALAKNLIKYKVNKLKGNLDYSLIRNCKTKLSQKELDYCINDIKVVMAYIQEEIENNRGIHNLPLTKTSKVRKFCRERCFKIEGTNKRSLNYKKMIRDLTIETMDEFNLLKRAFMGGFTHANANYVGDVLKNVSSFDFTSSYPFVMVSEKFPMSVATKIELESKEDFNLYINSYDKYLSVFNISFIELELYETYETPLSVSKCFEEDDVVENNGRVVMARKVTTTMTNIDFEVMKKFYKWKSIDISNLHIYKMEYLPTPLVKCILELYENKTTLKGVEGKEVEYNSSKEMVNSIYGMCVTNPLRDEHLYIDDTWTTHKNTEDEALELLYKYNTSQNRFLSYSWGIFVTAYARRNLFTGIHEFKNDYIYSDTDSIKVLNYDAHKDYLDKYNLEVANKLKEACEFHKIDFEKTQPKTKEGKIKPLGVWDFEGTYENFKTLGSKRYMYSKGDEISITVAGVNKKAGARYLKESGSGDILKAFENFEIGLEVPPDQTEKNIHAYLDYEQEGYLIDYQGNRCKYKELSSLHLEPTGFTMSMTKAFIDYLNNIKLKVE